MEEHAVPPRSTLTLRVAVPASRSDLVYWFNMEKKGSLLFGAYADPSTDAAASTTVTKGKASVPASALWLRALQACSLSEGTVRGTLQVPEAASCVVLVFDNTNSRNTKPLTVFTSIKPRPATGQGGESASATVATGALLKKKRKTLQGYARRHFMLASDGIMSYAATEGGAVRDAIQLATSSISVIPHRCAIHIDSGSMIWHLRALSSDDYAMWLRAIQAFKPDAAPSDAQEANTRAEVTASPDPDASSVILSEIHAVRRLLAHSAASSDPPPPPPPPSSSKPDKLKLRIARRTTLGSPASPHESSAPSSRSSTLNGSSPDPPAMPRDLAIKIEASLDAIQHEHARLQEDLRQSRIRMQDLQDANALLLAELAEIKQHALPAVATLSRSQRRNSMMSARSAADFFDASNSIVVADLASSDDDGSDDHDEAVPDDSAMNQSSASVTDGGTVPRTPDALSIIERRTALPADAPTEEISLVSILRKNIGKDLSSVAMPIAMNEPISLLQRMAEELEYAELLDKAAGLGDPHDRLMYVAAFLVSSYAASQYRTGRKPFNPLLGETYELHRPDKGFRFIAEKVNHHPPILASHAESSHYAIWQESRIKTKFWGKSMEFSPLGTTHLVFPAHGDHCTFMRPTTWMKNMIAGYRYLEHAGDVRIQNHTTGDYCLLSFKESGMFSSSQNEVTGGVYDARGRKTRTLSGRWNEVLVHEVSKERLEVLWRAHAPPPQHEQQYGLSYFALQLNEMTRDLYGVVPRTDTRLRPDQRLYEMGMVDDADAEKQRLEELQRQRRRELEAQGQTHQPVWFEVRDDPHSKEGRMWHYRGGYWEARDQGRFPEHLPELW